MYVPYISQISGKSINQGDQYSYSSYYVLLNKIKQMKYIDVANTS